MSTLVLHSGTCEEVSPGGYDPAQSVSEQADGMQPGTSASSSGGDSVDEANSAGKVRHVYVCHVCFSFLL